jgi:hypothetical protein
MSQETSLFGTPVESQETLMKSFALPCQLKDAQISPQKNYSSKVN